MQKLLRFIAAPLALALACCAIGCTIYGEKKPATLASTTSAEQYERILWEMAQKQQWNKISPLFSTTLVWNADRRSMRSGEVVPYLQSLQIKDVSVRDVIVQPNGPNMTVAYTLDFSSVGKDSLNAPVTSFLALSVWQQTKKGGWMLIAHSQEPLFAVSNGDVAR